MDNILNMIMTLYYNISWQLVATFFTGAFIGIISFCIFLSFWDKRED